MDATANPGHLLEALKTTEDEIQRARLAWDVT